MYGKEKVKIFEKKRYSKEPNFDEINTIYCCKEKLFCKSVCKVIEEYLRIHKTKIDKSKLNELNEIVDKRESCEKEDFDKFVFLVKKLKYSNFDLFEMRKENSENRILVGNKCFDFVVKQMIDDNSVLNNNREEYLDFIYYFLEEYIYKLVGISTNITYLDNIGCCAGIFEYIEEEIAINKSYIKKFDFKNLFFTIFHEYTHYLQFEKFYGGVMEYKYYVMLKEKVLDEYFMGDPEDNIKNNCEFYNDNYEVELSELDADKNGRLLYIEFLQKLGYSKKNIDEIVFEDKKDKFQFRDENAEVISENKFFNNSIYNLNYIFENSLKEIIKNSKFFWENNDIFKLEFYEDGTPKSKFEILQNFEKILNSELTKQEKITYLDLYFGILIKDNRLKLKENILKDYECFSNYKSDNPIIEKTRLAYLENLRSQIGTVMANQVQLMVSKELKTINEAREYSNSLSEKRKQIRYKKMNEINSKEKEICDEFLKS